MQKVYLVCGVPGSGKSWVCRQLEEKFTYLEHDEYLKLYPDAIYAAACMSEKPILADCPFGERLLRDELLERGLNVIPLFIVESPELVRARYEMRENHPIPKQHVTRASSISARAAEWHAPRGTSEEILAYLQELPV